MYYLFKGASASKQTIRNNYNKIIINLNLKSPKEEISVVKGSGKTDEEKDTLNN